MPTIYDLVTSNDIVAYYSQGRDQMTQYLGETLFPEKQKLGLKIDWIKGAAGLPVVLKPSSFDAVAFKRPRVNFDKLSAEMPYFKEGMYVNEELRQQLNMVLETGNQSLIDMVVNNIFDDATTLLRGAAAQRERIRMSILTTGALSISANGQAYDYDYGFPAAHKSTVTTSWSNAAADIMGDIETAQEKIYDDTGVKPTRAVVSPKTMRDMKKNTAIVTSIKGVNNSQAKVTTKELKDYIKESFDISLVDYGMKVIGEDGTTKIPLIADDLFVLFPEGELGTGWFGTTPEQSDLMSNSAANVTITDVGVAVTTSKKVDPVNVETKVSMIYLPSFPLADQVYLLDTSV